MRFSRIKTPKPHGNFGRQFLRAAIVNAARQVENNIQEGRLPSIGLTRTDLIRAASKYARLYAAKLSDLAPLVSSSDYGSIISRLHKEYEKEVETREKPINEAKIASANIMLALRELRKEILCLSPNQRLPAPASYAAFCFKRWAN